MASAVQVSFNSGEWSPWLDGRFDLEKYASACRVLENFVLTPYGGLRRRPGTEFLGMAKYADRHVRLLDFQFSVTTGFVLELGDEYLRFWSNGVQVTTGGPPTPLELVTPWGEAEVDEVQMVQINDVAYLAHPSHPPQKLTRIADDDWTLDEIEWEFPPMRDPNPDNSVTVTASAITGSVTLTASGSVFSADQVGGYFQVSHRRDDIEVELALTGNGNSSAVRSNDRWNLVTRGTWSGTIEVQANYGQGWETIHQYTSRNDRNVDAEGTLEQPGQVRIKFSYTASSGTPLPRAYLSSSSAIHDGVVRITAFTSPTVVSATVLVDLYSTAASYYWAEGAWSEKSGFPGVVALHENRLWFAGSEAQPQTLWASKIDDFETFQLGGLATDALAYTIASAEQSRIRWMISQNSLLIGTASSEWVWDSGSGEDPVSASNIRTRRQAAFGSAPVAAVLANDVALFVQRNGRKVREMAYSFEKDGYVAPDLTLLAEHVAKGGIRCLALQQQRDAVLWTVTHDGILAGMTYERAQDVVGWHRHTTDGQFLSVATLYADPLTSWDEVWVAVRREIDGGTVTCIERFHPGTDAALERREAAGVHYVDCVVHQVHGSPVMEVSGLDHLEGEQVAICADGAVHPSQVVTGGEVPLQVEASEVSVGLAFTSTIQPMRIEAQLQDGASQGRERRVHEVITQLLASGTFEVAESADADQWDRPPLREVADTMGEAVPLFDGYLRAYTPTGYGFDGTVAIRQRLPLPLNLLAMIFKLEVTGR